jgi:ketosteroid isomerase-like protein
MTDNLAVVSAIYEAFGRGDVQDILERLADEVQWESWTDNFAQRADVPYLRYKNGRQAVPEFFQEVGKLGIRDFRVVSLMAGENQVAAEIEIETATFSDEEIHLWNFNDEGKVSRFRHYVDTAKHIAAAEKAGS